MRLSSTTCFERPPAESADSVGLLLIGLSPSRTCTSDPRTETALKPTRINARNKRSLAELDRAIQKSKQRSTASDEKAKKSTRRKQEKRRDREGLPAPHVRANRVYHSPGPHRTAAQRQRAYAALRGRETSRPTARVPPWCHQCQRRCPCQCSARARGCTSGTHHARNSHRISIQSQSLVRRSARLPRSTGCD